MVLNDQYADGKVADFKDGDGIVTLQYERDPPPTNEVSGLAWNVGGRWECGCQNVPDVAVPAHRPVGGRRGGGGGGVDFLSAGSGMGGKAGCWIGPGGTPARKVPLCRAGWCDGACRAAICWEPRWPALD